MRSLYLAILVFTASCQKTETDKHLASEYFPNSIGNYWRYKYVDSVFMKSAMVDVKIVGDTTLPGGQNAKIWITKYPARTDTSFVYQVDDTIKFVNQGLSIRNAYIIPLQLNNQWRANQDYMFDSIRVSENRRYYMNNQYFENSFLLHESGHLPNERRERIEWFCPNVGMLTMTEYDAFLIANTTSTFYWELIDYDLK